MAEKTDNQGSAEEARIYEIGYHLLPIIPEEDVLEKHTSFKELVEKAGGALVEDSVPAKTNLAYDISKKIEGEKKDFSSTFFGWIKFEGGSELADRAEEAISADDNVLRHILVKTVRERTYVPKGERKEASVEEDTVETKETTKSSPKPASREEKKELTDDDKKAIDESIDELVSEE